jgi:hypothetical protein
MKKRGREDGAEQQRQCSALTAPEPRFNSSKGKAANDGADFFADSDDEGGDVLGGFIQNAKSKTRAAESRSVSSAGGARAAGSHVKEPAWKRNAKATADAKAAKKGKGLGQGYEPVAVPQQSDIFRRHQSQAASPYMSQQMAQVDEQRRAVPTLSAWEEEQDSDWSSEDDEDEEDRGPRTAQQQQHSHVAALLRKKGVAITRSDPNKLDTKVAVPNGHTILDGPHTPGAGKHGGRGAAGGGGSAGGGSGGGGGGGGSGGSGGSGGGAPTTKSKFQQVFGGDGEGLGAGTAAGKRLLEKKSRYDREAGFAEAEKALEAFDKLEKREGTWLLYFDTVTAC